MSDFFTDDSLELFYEEGYQLDSAPAYLLRLDKDKANISEIISSIDEYLQSAYYIVCFENLSKNGQATKDHYHGIFFGCNNTPKQDTLKKWKLRNLPRIGSALSLVTAKDPIKGLFYTVKQKNIEYTKGLDEEAIDKIMIDSSEYQEFITYNMRLSPVDMLNYYKTSLEDKPPLVGEYPAYSKEDIIIRLLRYFCKLKRLPPTRALMSQYVVYVQLQGGQSTEQIALYNYL